jgi:hypothetical protein
MNEAVSSSSVVVVRAAQLPLPVPVRKERGEHAAVVVVVERHGWRLREMTTVK